MSLFTFKFNSLTLLTFIHYSDWSDGHRRQHHRRYSSDSLQEAGPRTPPPPPMPPASPQFEGESLSKRHKADDRQKPDPDVVPQNVMLFPEDDMEAISDDDDLPDLPMEEVDVPAPAASVSVAVTVPPAAAAGSVAPLPADEGNLLAEY